MSFPASRERVAAPSHLPAISASPATSDRFWWAALAVLIVGIAARQLLLGSAPFHPDEAIHIFFAEGFGTYHYNPIYHGPLLYHLVAGAFALLGENDFSARLVPSMLGIGLLVLALFPLRRFVPPRAALASAALLAISPSLVTYSRHLLHDSLVLFLTMGAVLCFAATFDCPSDSRAGRNARIGLAAFLSLFLATKANFFFIAVMLLAFWIAWRASGWLRIPVWLQRWTPAFCFGAVIAASIWLPRDVTSDPITQASQHRSFSVIAVLACGVFWLWLMSRRAPESEAHYKEGATKPARAKTKPPIALATAQSAKSRQTVVAKPATTEVADKPFDIKAATLTYVLAGAAALWIYLYLFGNGAQILDQWGSLRSFPSQAFADGRENARTALGQMWDYWAGQQATPRLPGRHDYYAVLALLYEVPILVAAIGGIWHTARNRSVFGDLLLWWAFSSWAIYAVANEKVPWLLVHICLPLALLGGLWLGQLRLPRAGWIVGLTLGALFSLRGDIAMIFQRAGDNAEPILYAQSPDVFRDQTEAMLKQTRGDSRVLWMNNDTATGRDRQWPSVWYFNKVAPDVGVSGIAMGGQIDTAMQRAGVTTPDDAVNVDAMKRAGWQMQTVDFLIWPRASWTAMQPARYWRWFWTRDAFPRAERGLPQEQWKTSILGGTTVYRVPPGAPPGSPKVPTLIGKGEWSSVQAVVGWRKPEDR